MMGIAMNQRKMINHEYEERHLDQRFAKLMIFYYFKEYLSLQRQRITGIRKKI